jgi:hypothetical protein
MEYNLDKVCSNCNERFGQHFGEGRGYHYCDVEKYKFFDANPNIPVDLKYVFIYSGTCRSKFDKVKKCKTDPNLLFKLRHFG